MALSPLTKPLSLLLLRRLKSLDGGATSGGGGGSESLPGTTARGHEERGGGAGGICLLGDGTELDGTLLLLLPISNTKLSPRLHMQIKFLERPPGALFRQRQSYVTDARGEPAARGRLMAVTYMLLLLLTLFRAGGRAVGVQGAGPGKSAASGRVGVEAGKSGRSLNAERDLRSCK